MEVSLWDVFSA